MKLDISQFNPCHEGGEYYKNKPSFEAAWNECPRGDWMLWIAARLRVDNRILTGAKAMCANTVRHLMKDERSTGAIDAALRYSKGKATLEDLVKRGHAATDARAAARAAADAVHADAAYAAVYTDAYAAYAAACATDAYTAACAAGAAAYTAACAANAAGAAGAAAYTAACAARKSNQLETASICREVLTEAVLEKVEQLKNDTRIKCLGIGNFNNN